LQYENVLERRKRLIHNDTTNITHACTHTQRQTHMHKDRQTDTQRGTLPIVNASGILSTMAEILALTY
jgi:hypothetical protein